MDKQKTKILLIVRHPVGGIRTFLKYVYNKFDPDIYSFSLIAPVYPETQILLNDLKYLDVQFIPVDGKNIEISLFCVLLREICRHNYHLIHSHGLTSGIITAIPAKICRIPHILTLHDVFTDKQFKGFSGFLKMLVIKFTISMVNKIHFVSNDACNDFMNKISNKYNTEKFVTIVNGIEVEQFSNSCVRNFRKELLLDDDSFLVGFCGRFMAQKGFIYLVDALDLILTERGPEKKVYLLAFGGDGFVREDTCYVESLGISSNVYFLPFEPDLGPVLKGLNVLVMPSLWEACGLLAMEALVAGVPLITSDCIGLREVTRNTPSIVVPTRNSEAIAGAISNEIDKPSTDIFTDFIHTAQMEFDVKKQSKSLMEIYKELLLK